MSLCHQQVVCENSMPTFQSPLFNEFLPTLYSAWRGGRRRAGDGDSPGDPGHIEFDGNVCTAF